VAARRSSSKRNDPDNQTVLSSIYSTEKAQRGNGIMSAGITGTQPHTSNDTNQANGNHAQPSQPEAAPQHHQLTPDRPPHPVESGESKPKRPRGFAAMDRKLVSEIARKGGKAAHSAGTAHEFTSEEARVAGRKGGRATHAKRRKVEGDSPGEPQTEEKPGG
jgi:general stress protein YciG